MTHDSRLLVSGASGQLGRRVLHHLLKTLQVPPHRLIATTRRPEAVSDVASLGVDVRTADFADDVDTLATAFRDASRILVISSEAGPHGVRLAQHRRAIMGAVQAGASHVVYTSMPDPSGSLVSFAPDHAESEAALAASALPGWTVLRNHWYFENWFHSIPQALQSGVWYTAAGEGKLANIARDDVARAAAVILASTDTSTQTYTLSGAKALTTREIAAAISAAVGDPLAVVDVSQEALVQGLMASGLPEAAAREIASFDANAAAGGFSGATGDYKAITGREPLSLDEWCRANRSALIGTQ
jgi:NAD(P)H dehydrogenase (quinone)